MVIDFWAADSIILSAGPARKNMSINMIMIVFLFQAPYLIASVVSSFGGNKQQTKHQTNHHKPPSSPLLFTPPRALLCSPRP